MKQNDAATFWRLFNHITAEYFIPTVLIHYNIIDRIDGDPKLQKTSKRKHKHNNPKLQTYLTIKNL